MMDNRLLAASMRALVAVLFAAGILGLSGCGGGNGSPSNLVKPPDPPPIPPTLVVVPASAQLTSGIPATLTVTGGTAPYYAFTSNSAVLPVAQAVIGSTIPLLAASVTGIVTLQITVLDSGGQSFVVPISVIPPSVQTLVVAPAVVTILPSFPTVISISGGRAPYRVFSSNPTLLPVGPNVTGSTFTLVAGSVSVDTVVTITVLDALDSTATVTVTVSARPVQPLVLAPDTLTIYPGAGSTLLITGGVPPYTVVTTNPAVLPVTTKVTGNIVPLLANPVVASTIVRITVFDSTGLTASSAVTVTPQPVPTLVVTPSSITVKSGETSLLSVAGGAPPYSAYSSNPAVLPVSQSVTNATVALLATATAANTPVTITVRDSSGLSAASSVTVLGSPVLVVSPAAPTAYPGVPMTLSISGGVAPYTATTSNAVLLPIQAVSGSTVVLLPGKVSADTIATITVQDSVGTSVASVVTVKAAQLISAMTITPDILNCGPGSGATTICSGQNGTASVKITDIAGVAVAGNLVRFDVVAGDYSIQSTNPVNPLPSTATVITDAVGSATVRLLAFTNASTQSALIRATDVTSGNQLTGQFTIIQSTSGASVLTVVPATAKITTLYNDTCSSDFVIDYYIYGGTPPYRVTNTFPLSAVFLNSTTGAVIPGSTFTVTNSGGFFRVATNGSCVDPLNFSIFDAIGLQTTAQLQNVPGSLTRPAPPTPPAPVVTPPSIVVSPTAVTAIPSPCDGKTFSILVTSGTPPYSVSGSTLTVINTLGVPPTTVTPPTGTAVTPVISPVPLTGPGYVNISGLRSSGTGGVVSTYVFLVSDAASPKQTAQFTISCNPYP